MRLNKLFSVRLSIKKRLSTDLGHVLVEKSMATNELLPLPVSKGLSDRLSEKRKSAALEIERLVREKVEKNEFGDIKEIIVILQKDFTLSVNPNNRKGGLMGLAATAIALGKTCIGMHLPELIPPILACFQDQDPRVRYAACESLYNTVKISRSSTLMFFNPTFDGLSRLIADNDANVRYGAEMLDKLVKDIVTESPHFDLDQFIPLIRTHIYSLNHFVRQFVVSWIVLLDQIPDVHMYVHLPEFLDGLITILGDNNKEIRKMAEACLGEFLKEIKAERVRDVRFQDMTNIIVLHAMDERQLIQLTALQWMKTFLELAGAPLLPFTANILTAILPCLSYDSEKMAVKHVASEVNQQLKLLITPENDVAPDSTTVLENTLPDSTSSHGNQSSDAVENGNRDNNSTTVDTSPLNMVAVLEVLLMHMNHRAQDTRIEALTWLLWLHKQVPRRTYLLADKLFPSLMNLLSDNSDKVVTLDLTVVKMLATSKAYTDSSGNNKLTPYFRQFLVQLLQLFQSNRRLLETRGSFIIRQLCVLVDAHHLYITIAQILLDEGNLEFASLMVVSLNMILFTTKELHELRLELQNLANTESWELFSSLYHCWCHNSVATVALCLLSQNYEHASQLIEYFGNIEITSGFLQEVDKLVQLLESPIFTFLRLQLLDPHGHSELVRSLYGILMLLPQSMAFTTLQHRLSCVPTLLATQPKQKSTSFKRKIPANIKFDLLFQHFQSMQSKHYQANKAKTMALLTIVQHNN